MAALDFADIQPGIVSIPWGSARPGVPAAPVFGLDVFATINATSVRERRSQFAALLDLARTVNGADLTVTVGLTGTGLARLMISPDLVALFPGEFAAGASARRTLLGDPIPTGADCAFDNDAIDVVIMIAATSKARVEETRVATQSMATGIVSTETYLTADRKEHFGFRDGIGNPPLEGAASGSAANGVWVDDPNRSHWRPLRAGEILFGAVNEVGILPGPRVLHDLLRNGSFLVWRKIAQDVEGFHWLAEMLAREQSEGVPTQPQIDAYAARIVGRDREGNVPDAVGDDFNYAHPNLGVPLQSHIRRSNPRATAGFGEKRVAKRLRWNLKKREAETVREYGGTHRIVRRSMLFDESATTGTSGLRGTIFRCYQTSIADQFEFIQRNWLNDGNVFGQGRSRDPVAGQNAPPGIGCPAATSDPRESEANAVFDLSRKPSLVRLERITTPLATVYAFVPGYQAIRDLVAGRFDA